MDSAAPAHPSCFAAAFAFHVAHCWPAPVRCTSAILGSNMWIGVGVSNSAWGLSVKDAQALAANCLATSQAVQCSSLQSVPLDPRHFLVAADGGRVLKGSWVGTAPAPKEYVAHDHGAAATLGGTGRARVPTCVTAIHVSPVCGGSHV